MHIVDIRAFEALDSRGNPTLEVEVALSDGACGARWCRRARPLASVKPASGAMAIRVASMAEASWTRPVASTRKCAMCCGTCAPTARRT